MRRRIDRALTVAGLFVAVLWAWSLAARTGWAAGRDALAAGPGYLDALTPLLDIAGATLVTVTSLGLIRRAWTWAQVRLLGRAPARPRIPVERARQPVGVG